MKAMPFIYFAFATIVPSMQTVEREPMLKANPTRHTREGSDTAEK